MATVTETDLVDGLQRLGVRKGDFLEVHSSLSSFGSVEGGAETVINSVLRCIGPSGAVVMPAAPASKAVPLTEDEKRRGLTWKVRVLPSDDLETPTFQGLIADLFRTWPGVVRNSYSAWGARAAEFSLGLEPFVEAGGRCLLLGVGFNRASCLHVGDSRVRSPAEVSRLFAPPPELLRDYPDDTWWIGYDARRPGAEFDNSQLLEDEAERRGLLARTMIGIASAVLFDADPVIEMSVQLRNARPYRMAGVEPPTPPT